MDGMSRTGRTGRAAARLLSMLAVVLGLLAMHGLASTHHAAAASSHAWNATAEIGFQPQDLTGTQRHDHRATDAPAAALALLDGTAAGPVAPACGDDCTSGLAVLCAAVVAAAAVIAWLVTATARRAVLSAPARVGARPRAPDAARRLLPGPDPVAELCVSRT